MEVLVCRTPAGTLSLRALTSLTQPAHFPVAIWTRVFDVSRPPSLAPCNHSSLPPPRLAQELSELMDAALEQHCRREEQSIQTEYEKLMGGASQEARVPQPSAVFSLALEELGNPFYDAGPNDKGIGIQLGYSILRVLVGFSFAIIVAIPLGFLIGMSPLFYRALDPFIQILKPVSPLAWLPIVTTSIRGETLSKKSF